MLEKQVEEHLTRRVKAAGGLPYKFTSPARRSVPDRLCLLPVSPEHRAIVARYVRFVEAKRPGGKPTSSQLREHERLRELGYFVTTVDSKGAVDGLYPGVNIQDSAE